MSIKKTVDTLIRKYKTRDPFELVECKNGFVVFVPLSGVRGFFQYFQRNNIVYIDENLSDHDKQLVCAHELGHMILHKKINSYWINTYTSLNTTIYETEANMFAMYLLISDDDLADCREYGYTVEQMSRLYGYSESLIKLRLEED